MVYTCLIVMLTNITRTKVYHREPIFL